MNLEIQWFIYALVSNEIASADDCLQLYQGLSGNPDLQTYAQTFLDNLAGSMAPADLQSFASQIEEVMSYAAAQAASGESPELFASAEEGAATAEEADAPCEASSTTVTADYSQLPELNGIAKKSKEEISQTLSLLLVNLRNMGASDLHLSAGAIPFIRRSLKLERIGKTPLSAEDAEALNTTMLSTEQRDKFTKEMDLNYSLEIGTSRFRIALMQHKDGTSGSYRLVPDRVKSLKELGFMEKDIPTINTMLSYTNGLVLVTGPLGSGKTSTLAAMVDILNNTRQDHVITVEDPIEIVQDCKGCQLTQREIGRDTASYHSALKGALREDPDVIVIGEMHDLETIENAITASETGHLVIGTLHTGDAANTLNRLLDVFPPAQQPQIRAMTSGSLRGIVCQKLIPAIDGSLTLAYEILVNTMAVASLINEGKTFQLAAQMQIGAKQGMCTLDQCILEKYVNNVIDYETAKFYIRGPAEKQQLAREYGMRQARSLSGK